MLRKQQLAIPRYATKYASKPEKWYYLAGVGSNKKQTFVLFRREPI